MPTALLPLLASLAASSGPIGIPDVESAFGLRIEQSSGLASVVRLDPTGRAAAGGVRPDDIVIQVGATITGNARVAERAFESHTTGPIRCVVQRQGVVFDLTIPVEAVAAPTPLPADVTGLDRFTIEPNSESLLKAWKNWRSDRNERDLFRLYSELEFLERIGRPDEAKPVLATQSDAYLRLGTDNLLPEYELVQVIRSRARFDDLPPPAALNHGERLIRADPLPASGFFQVAEELATHGQKGSASVWIRMGLEAQHAERAEFGMASERLLANMRALHWRTRAGVVAAMDNVGNYSQMRPGPSEGQTMYDLEVVRAGLLGDAYSQRVAEAATDELMTMFKEGSLLINFDYDRFATALHLGGEVASLDAAERALRKWTAASDQGFQVLWAWALSRFLAGRGDLSGSYDAIEAVLASFRDREPTFPEALSLDDLPPILGGGGTLAPDAEVVLLLAAARSTPSVYWSTQSVPELRERSKRFFARMHKATFQRLMEDESEMPELLGALGLDASALRFSKAVDWDERSLRSAVTGALEAGRLADAQQWMESAGERGIDSSSLLRQAMRAGAAYGAEVDLDPESMRGLPKGLARNYWRIRAQRSAWNRDVDGLRLAAERLEDDATWTLLAIASDRLSEFDPVPPVAKTKEQLLADRFPALAECQTSASRVMRALSAARGWVDGKPYLVFGSTDGSKVCVATEFRDALRVSTLARESDAAERIVQLQTELEITEELASALAFEASMPVPMEKSYRRFGNGKAELPSYGLVTDRSPSLAEIERFLEAQGGVPEDGYAWFEHAGVVFAVSGDAATRRFARTLSEGQIAADVAGIIATRDRVESQRAQFEAANKSHGPEQVAQMWKNGVAAQYVMLAPRLTAKSLYATFGAESYEGVLAIAESYEAAKPIKSLRSGR